jgi:hypothetical protein
MTIKQRLKSPMPTFFKKLRNIGLAIAAVGTTLLTAPAALPVIVIKIAGYLTVAGSVASAISQVSTTVDSNSKESQ